MEEALLILIAGISEQKKAEKIHPTFALRMDINKAINEALNNLYKAGKIKVGTTLNDKWMEVII